MPYSNHQGLIQDLQSEGGGRGGGRERGRGEGEGEGRGRGGGGGGEGEGEGGGGVVTSVHVYTVVTSDLPLSRLYTRGRGYPPSYIPYISE